MRWTLLLGTVALGACASSVAIDEGANRHLLAAEALQARGDFRKSEEEQAAADKQFAKAQRRADEEAHARPAWFCDVNAC